MAGTKIHANASKHQDLSWKHACDIEKQLQEEVHQPMLLAEKADQADIPDGMDIHRSGESNELIDGFKRF